MIELLVEGCTSKSKFTNTAKVPVEVDEEEDFIAPPPRSTPKAHQQRSTSEEQKQQTGGYITSRGKMGKYDYKQPIQAAEAPGALVKSPNNTIVELKRVPEEKVYMAHAATEV
ncbi:hypothetical protein LXL04_010900 [Taraxacum kok-saghyz]